jgi:hypothetical protein
LIHLFSSVAFWYQAEPHKPWPALPPRPVRLPFHDNVLLKRACVIRVPGLRWHPNAAVVQAGSDLYQPATTMALGVDAGFKRRIGSRLKEDHFAFMSERFI